MSGPRRFFIALLAPLVVVVGLSGIWAGRNATQLKAQIEEWVDALEHSPEPVTMNLSFVPAYVDGDKVGMLRTIVVQRQEPGAVDGVDLVIEVGDRGVGRLSSCSFQFDPEAFEHSGPWGFKNAIECVDNAEGLVEFGTVSVLDADFEALLYLDPSDVPCHSAGANLRDVCSHEIRDNIRRLREEIRTDLRESLREIEIEIDQAKFEVQRANADVKVRVGGN